MAYTLADAKDDLSGIVHGKTVNKITNINQAAQRAARKLLAQIDPDETRVIGQVSLFDQVVDYASFTDIKEKRVIDIRPQFETTEARSVTDNLSNRTSKDFDLRRSWGAWFTVMNNKGTQYFRIKAELTETAITLDPLNVLGKWTATTAAQNLALESVVFEQGGLQFDMAASSPGYIENTALTQVDLTTSVNKSSAFLELYIPTAAALAALVSVDLRWGNDTTVNYYNRTVTAPHIGSFVVGKNLLRFDWNGATKTGTIDPTKIDSARITINTNGTAISALIVSDLFFSIANVWDIEYYSKYLFNHGGTWSDKVTDDTDTLNLDTASYNLFLFEFALAALQQIQGKDAMADRQYFQEQLYGNPNKDINGLYNDYKKNNPTQAEKVTQSYYSNLGWRGNNGDGVRIFRS